MTPREELEALEREWRAFAQHTARFAEPRSYELGQHDQLLACANELRDRLATLRSRLESVEGDAANGRANCAKDA